MERPMLEDTLVRHEFCGPLVWAGKLASYYLPKTEEVKNLLLEVLRRKEEGFDWKHGLGDENLVNELILLGLDGNVREISSSYADRLSAPLEMYFDYTWLCNLAKSKCGKDSYCYARGFLGTTTMQLEEVNKIICELYDWGVMRLHLAGGEPTINKRAFANYLDVASSYGLYTSMATNGLLVDEEIIEIILRNHLKSVSFSLEGSTEEEHAQVRGSGLFDRTIKSIKLMVKLRNEARATTRVCIKPTYNVNTKHSTLENLVRLAIDLEVDVIKFANPERCLHHEQGHYGKEVEKYYETIFFVRSLQERYGDKITITNISNPIAGCTQIGIPGLQGCIGAQELLAINPNGNVTPCLMHPYNLGNILTEYSSLKSFWASSEKLVTFLGALAKPDSCKGCGVYSACRSGSVTRRIVEAGKFSSDRTTGLFSEIKDPLCPTDYLKNHPEVKLDIKPDTGDLTYFKAINVRHSL